ncbi:MAG: tetratricopeptide repeat protein [Candidatus Thorarchaeota archaeon]|jgi:tetratricopeptide (TPR) repeat protein
MKPMGSITKYYPFIDEESKSLLNSLMDESSSYYDFVQRLCDVVLEKEVPVNLVYLAAVHAWWARVKDTMSLIQEKYKDVACIRPWGYIHATSLSDQERYHDAVVEAIERAKDSSLDDWMETDLHLLHTFFHWPAHGDIPSYLEPLEKAKRLIETNPVLNCFESLICGFEGWVKVRERDLKDSLVVFQRGLELAWVYDDSLFKYFNLLGDAFSLINFNIQDSLTRYEELYDLVQDLEVPYFIAEVLNDVAHAYEAAGEYDLAISSHLEGIKIMGDSDTSCLLLSRLYSTLGDGQQALEWANRAIKYVGDLDFPVLYLRKACASALVNRIGEAEHNLDAAHSLIMKTGTEEWLGDYYHISGVIELARGDYLAALDFLKRAWEIAERNPIIGLIQNRALFDLARAEISLDNQSTDSAKVVTPGKWLSKLEKYSVERDLPGIRMLAALLKSEFYQNHGQLKDAHGTLLDSLNITDSLGVATLRKKINKRIGELNQLLREADVSTE